MVGRQKFGNRKFGRQAINRECHCLRPVVPSCAPRNISVPRDVIRCAAKTIEIKLKTLPKNIKLIFLTDVFTILL